MDEFIEELMVECTHHGMYDNDIPIYVIEELLDKHFDIKFDALRYHYRPTKKPVERNPLIPDVYGKVITDQLVPPNTIFVITNIDE